MLNCLIEFIKFIVKTDSTDLINRGRGVLIAIESLISSKFIELEDISIEQICVNKQKTLGNIYIFNSYIPPQSPLAVFKSHMDNIVHITNGRSFSESVIVLEHFNLGTIIGAGVQMKKGLCGLHIFLWIVNKYKKY